MQRSELEHIIRNLPIELMLQSRLAATKLRKTERNKIVSKIEAMFSS